MAGGGDGELGFGGGFGGGPAGGPSLHHPHSSKILSAIVLQLFPNDHRPVS